MKLLRHVNIAILVSMMLSLGACKTSHQAEQLQLFEKTMTELSQQNAFHVSMVNEHTIDGITEEGVSQEIWTSSDNSAITIHLPHGTQNTLFYEGVFYVQHEENGQYEISDNNYTVPKLWADILNTITSEDISSTTLAHTDSGKVLTVHIKSDKTQGADISVAITYDSNENISSIVTTAEWEQIIDGEIRTIQSKQTTKFLSKDKTTIDRIIDNRVSNTSKEQISKNNT